MRGYFYRRLKFRTSEVKKQYFLDFTPKADYPYKDSDGLPIVWYNQKWISFPVTTINYFLGRIDADILSAEDIDDLLGLLKNLESKDDFLFKHNFKDKNWGMKPVWFSNLPQAMFFSLACRLNKFYDFTIDLNSVYEIIFHPKIYRNGIFLEYPGINSQPQNGQMFGIFAMIDAVAEGIDDNSNLKRHLSITYSLIENQITWYGWTKYNQERLASPFYHILHLDQYQVLKQYDKRFNKLYLKGLIGFIFLPYVITVKVLKNFFK